MTRGASLGDREVEEMRGALPEVGSQLPGG